MPTITVLEKLYGSISPSALEKLYSRIVEGLDVNLSFVGTTNRGWIKLDISGQDKTVAMNLLDREVGLAPTLNNLEKFATVRGKIATSKKDDNQLHVDLGVCPDILDAFIPERRLCAQLADAKNISFQDLIDLFCLHDNIPLEIKIVENANEKATSVKAFLSEAQLSLFKSWIRSRFDRLFILGSLLSDVEQAVKKSRHSRDVIKIESLGSLEHVVLCKLGTDAVGLIPTLGRYLKSSVLAPFSPKKIIEAIGSQSFDWGP